MPRSQKKLSDYSLSALESNLHDSECDVGGLDEEIIVKRSDNEYIDDYSREDYSYGATCIKYSRKMKPSMHFKGAFMTLGLSLPFTILTDVVMRAGLGKHTHYFHTASGEELGTSRNESAERSNEIGQALMREGRYSEARSYFDIAYRLCESSYRNENRFKQNTENARQCEERENEERERIAREARERERIAREEREREAREARERERIAREAREREAIERIARQARERERIAREARERERIAREARERERIAREAIERERIAREARERERIAREARERERIAREARERERIARERERIAREARERERIAREEREREARERERIVREEREREARERERIVREEREREARERERIVREARERARIASEAGERERMIREARDREAKHGEAERKYRRGRELWNEAFVDELNDEETQANRKFQWSYQLFCEAFDLNQNNHLFKSWIHICELKLEGNDLFNEAIALQEEAARLLNCNIRCNRTQLYNQARRLYEQAKEKYQEGLDKSNDERFRCCIEIVEECIQEMSEAALCEDLRDVSIQSSAGRNTQSTGLYYHNQYDVFRIL